MMRARNLLGSGSGDGPLVADAMAGGGGAVTVGEPVRRAEEIEEISNLYVIHPLAGWLARLFAGLGISANAVSLTGMALGVLAGFAYYHFRDLAFALAGFALMVGWHVLDGADGQVARLTHTQSELGKVLDGICDYVTFTAVYVGLALSLSAEWGGWIWPLMLLAGICHAVQSAAYERQRQEYSFWARERPAAEHENRGTLHPGTASSSWLAGLLHRFYGWMQLCLSGPTVEFHEQLAAALKAEPGRAEAIGADYRASFAPALRQWSILSANYHTLAIFIAAAFKAPQYYFWFEIVGFNAVLIALLMHQRARYARFLDSMNTVE